MTTPNMSSDTSSLEKSLQKVSLNHHHHNSYSNNSSRGGGGGAGTGTSGGFQENEHDDGFSNSTSETTYELNSHISLPYHWEQCLDLKTGELYYINWTTGMKAKDDPRTAEGAELNGDFVESEDDSSYDSEDSSTDESTPSFSRDQCINKISCSNYNYNNQSNERGNVLVVAGCKICMMYFMVPKQVEDCPKCNGQLLHFDKSENASSP